MINIINYYENSNSNPLYIYFNFLSIILQMGKGLLISDSNTDPQSFC